MNALHRDMLAAVLEALDIPRPATTGDVDRYRQVLDDRAEYARIALHALLESKSPEVIAYLVSELRRRIATVPPIGYRTAGQLAAERDAHDDEGTGR